MREVAIHSPYMSIVPLRTPLRWLTWLLWSLVFFVVVTPVGVVRRLFGMRSMRHVRADAESAFVHREHQYEPRDLETMV